MSIAREQDVAAFNELQYLNSIANIYFAGPIEKGEAIAESFRAVADRKPSSRFRMWQGISEGIVGDLECFRRLREGEKFDPKTPRIQSFSPLYPVPAHWISNLKMRRKLVGWIKPGTMIGPVRSYHAKKRAGMRPITIGHRPLLHRDGELPERMYHQIS